MKTETKKFLKFNGKSIYFISSDGQYWIAIKPICEALGVDYSRQLRTLKEDEIIGQLWSLQTIVATDNKLRKMVSLPEFFVYGWLMQIQSDSPELQKYQWECYKVLYQYFHGAITGRKSLLSEKAKTQIEIDQVFNRLPPDDALILDRAKTKMNRINNELRRSDGEILQEEMDLFNS